MANQLFNPMVANGQNPMLQQFQNFMSFMRGQDPNQIINNLVSSGKVSQQQLNQVQQQAQRVQGMFDQIKGNFNF